MLKSKAMRPEETNSSVVTLWREIILLCHQIFIKITQLYCMLHFSSSKLANKGSLIEPEELMLCIKLLRDLFTLVTDIIFMLTLTMKTAHHYMSLFVALLGCDLSSEGGL